MLCYAGVVFIYKSFFIRVRNISTTALSKVLSKSANQHFW